MSVGQDESWRALSVVCYGVASEVVGCDVSSFVDDADLLGEVAQLSAVARPLIVE